MLPMSQKPEVIYQTECNCGQANYVGKIDKQVLWRVHEHELAETERYTVLGNHPVVYTRAQFGIRVRGHLSSVGWVGVAPTTGSVTLYQGFGQWTYRSGNRCVNKSIARLKVIPSKPGQNMMRLGFIAQIMTTPEAVLRCTLYRIIQACGESGATSEDVVNALFKYAVSLRDQWSVRISSVTPLNLDTLVEAFADRAVILARIFMYLMVSGTSTGTGSKEASMNNEDFDDFQPNFVDDISAACATNGAAVRMHSPKVAKFLELCRQHCAAPPPETLFDWRSLEQNATPPRIHQGRRLRMLRIDDFVGSISIEAYVEFTKLRQSASFFATRNVLLAFLHWFFSSETASQRFTAGDLLAYLFTSGLYDLIDLAFCNRRLLGIQLSSPITSVELEQASLLIRRLSYL